VELQRVIGVDLGGTKILAGVVDRSGHVQARHEVPTPTESQDALLEGVAAAVEAVRDEGVVALGFGVPSVVDPRTGVSLGSINIPLEGVSVASVLGARFGLPAAVDNDAGVAALAEWRLGAGRGEEDLVMLTLGTGVGGGVVLGGRLARGWSELGHVVVLADGPPCQGACTGRGHLEALVSGSAADRAAEELWGPGSTAEQLVERAAGGDEAARASLRRIGHLLGAGVGSLVNVFGIRLFLVGGGFGLAAADFLLGSAVEAARREALAPGRDVRLESARLGGDAGLVGAGLLAFAALDGEV
jgi:glucokinase